MLALPPDDGPAAYGQLRTDRSPSQLCASLRGAGLDAREDGRTQAGPGAGVRVFHKGARFRLEQAGAGEYSVSGEAAEEPLLREAAHRLSIVLRGLSVRHRLEVYSAQGAETAVYQLDWARPEDAWDGGSGAGADLTFEEWVDYVFDRPTEGPEWYWQDDADWWRGTPDQIVRYLARLFEEAGQVLAPFSDAQVNAGLWYVASNGLSDPAFALMDERVPWPARRRAIRAMVDLFAGCLAPRCSPGLSHRSESGLSPLNSACYMWFDLLPIGGAPADPARDRIGPEVLGVLRAVLALPSEACQESALHGLGHWHAAYPRVVQEVVDGYLRSHPDLRPELRQYARSARCGCVQ